VKSTTKETILQTRELLKVSAAITTP